jgi:hypothetical protein
LLIFRSTSQAIRAAEVRLVVNNIALQSPSTVEAGDTVCKNAEVVPIAQRFAVDPSSKEKVAPISLSRNHTWRINRCGRGPSRVLLGNQTRTRALQKETVKVVNLAARQPIEQMGKQRILLRTLVDCKERHFKRRKQRRVK